MHASPVIFDCDGVLVDSEVIHLAVEREHLAALGLVYEDAAYLTRFVGLADAAFRREIERDHRARGLGPLPAGTFERMAAQASGRLERALRPLPGAAAFAAGLRGPRAVASSSNAAALEFKLRKTGLRRYFGPHVHAGDQVANGKPAPDLFLRAARGLGADPADCRVIEESVNGVRAARAAGMEAWGFAGGGHADADLPRRLRAAGAMQVFSSFAEASAFLGQP